MEDQVRREVREFAAELAKKHQSELEGAGTFVDIEELTAEIGDEVARQLANLELQRRSQAVGEASTHPCPDCDAECPIEADLEPVILQGMRGEIEYQEPRCYCNRCRRSFFPSVRSIGTSAAREPDAQGAGESRVGGREPGQLSPGRCGDG